MYFAQKTYFPVKIDHLHFRRMEKQTATVSVSNVSEMTVPK